MTGLPPRISESQISQVLRRAAEIDAGGESVSVEELRRIAAEAGIAAEATDRALQELFGHVPGLQPVAADAPATLAEVTASVSPLRMIAGGAAGIASGLLIGVGNLLTPVTLPNLVGLGALVGTTFYLFWRALASMKRGAQFDYQMQNLAHCLGVAAALIGTNPMLTGDAISIVAVVWVVAAVVGGLIVKLGSGKKGSGEGE